MVGLRRNQISIQCGNNFTEKFELTDEKLLQGVVFIVQELSNFKFMNHYDVIFSKCCFCTI